MASTAHFSFLIELLHAPGGAHDEQECSPVHRIQAQIRDPGVRLVCVCTTGGEDAGYGKLVHSYSNRQADACSPDGVNAARSSAGSKQWLAIAGRLLPQQRHWLQPSLQGTTLVQQEQQHT